MALDENFAEAWLNTKHKVFGFRLHPFSVWHKFLLSTLDVAQEGKIKEEASITDLYLSCMICGLRYPQQPRKVSWWSYLRMFWFLPGNRLMKAANSFKAYADDYVAMPEFWEASKEKSSKGGPPEELVTVVALMSMGFTEKQAWDMPIGKATWYSTTYASWNGADLDFVTAKERKMRENWEEMEAELREMADNYVPAAGPERAPPGFGGPPTDGRMN